MIGSDAGEENENKLHKILKVYQTITTALGS